MAGEKRKKGSYKRKPIESLPPCEREKKNNSKKHPTHTPFSSTRKRLEKRRGEGKEGDAESQRHNLPSNLHPTQEKKELKKDSTMHTQAMSSKEKKIPPHRSNPPIISVPQIPLAERK